MPDNRLIAHHYGKGFGFSTLSLSQSANRFAITCINRKMKTTNSFQRNNPPLFKKRCGLSCCIRYTAGFAGRVEQREGRAARRACIGLGVKTTIERIVVLLFTFRTHCEAMHRCKLPVIRQAFYNSVAGTAIGAVDKRVTKPTVSRIHKLTTTVAAERNIRRNESLDFSTGA